MLKFDPNLRWLFTEFPMQERYAAAARAGFKGVEVAFPYEEPAAVLARRLKDLDLTLVQILAPFDWDSGVRGIASFKDKREEFRSGFQRAVDYSAQVGRPMIHVMPGNLEPGVDTAPYLAEFEENIAFAADVAAKENVTVILEPCCRARFPNFMYHRLQEGVDVIEKVGRDNVKLCFDTFHVGTEEGSITDRLKALYSYIGHMQIGNVPGRHEPGPGEIHFPYLFEQIEALGWNKFIGCEYTPSAHTQATLGWARPFGVNAEPQSSEVAHAH
ncbi:hydroxypyruvate isomerase family protein [soil metagenome]